ncbi:helix-turn-helix domain-containing protein [Alicyclobacillus sp. SO9]|uniref:helix-turn-helix domain-containing protein n=1 Tax=Alicyclobacillus sp. SO9 TaxID=2665646 RepID=UPI0018E90497|nr:helix-turn-helix transcriptional regulator [Alicyclobacillus sp. SO9]
MSAKNRVGGRIQALRKAQTMSLRRLGELSGVSASQLSKIEAGTHDTTVGTLENIAQALGCTAAELLSDSMDGVMDLEMLCYTSAAWRTTAGVLYPTDEERKLMAQQIRMVQTYLSSGGGEK